MSTEFLSALLTLCNLPTEREIRSVTLTFICLELIVKAVRRCELSERKNVGRRVETRIYRLQYLKSGRIGRGRERVCEREFYNKRGPVQSPHSLYQKEEGKRVA